jgi:hypothetical protein
MKMTEIIAKKRTTCTITLTHQRKEEQRIPQPVNDNNREASGVGSLDFSVKFYEIAIDNDSGVG